MSATAVGLKKLARAFVVDRLQAIAQAPVQVV
jgi:hypothetical protein